MRLTATPTVVSSPIPRGSRALDIRWSGSRRAGRLAGPLFVAVIWAAGLRIAVLLGALLCPGG